MKSKWLLLLLWMCMVARPEAWGAGSQISEYGSGRVDTGELLFRYRIAVV